MVGDISEPAILARAIRGVQKVYHIGPTIHPRERDMGLAVVDAARAEGVRHLVFSSVLHAITTDLVQHEIKRDIEEHLLSSGLEFTILQPANYMLPLKLRPVFEKGVFELSWSLERRQSLVDLGDVTDVACMALIDSERHAGATYELVAAGRYTAYELGDIISRVLGRQIAVRAIDADTYLKAWVGDADPRQVTHQVEGATRDHSPLQQPRLRRQPQRAHLAARTVAHDLRSLRPQSARRLPAERFSSPG